MASSYRVDRVRELLLREFSDIVMHLKDPRVGMVTVMDVELSRDLRYAKMFVSVVGGPEEREQAVLGLQNALGYIRREIGRRVRLRHVPEITVVYDDTPERAVRLIRLIDSLSDGGDREDERAEDPSSDR